MLAAAEYRASSSLHRVEKEREKEREREKIYQYGWIEREVLFPIPFGFTRARFFASRPLLHLRRLFFLAIWLVLSSTRAKSSLVSYRVALRPVTHTLPGLRRFSPTVLRFFCMRFFRKLFYFFFGFL